MKKERKRKRVKVRMLIYLNPLVKQKSRLYIFLRLTYNDFFDRPEVDEKKSKFAKKQEKYK